MDKLTLCANLLLRLEEGGRPSHELTPYFAEPTSCVIQCLKKLKALGFIDSIRGPDGGYWIKTALPTFGELTEALGFSSYGYSHFLKTASLYSLFTGTTKGEE